MRPLDDGSRLPHVSPDLVEKGRLLLSRVETRSVRKHLRPSYSRRIGVRRRPLRFTACSGSNPFSRSFNPLLRQGVFYFCTSLLHACSTPVADFAL